MGAFLQACSTSDVKIQDVLQTHGGMAAFYAFRDVSFDVKSKNRVEHERFRFSDEKCLVAPDCKRAFFLFAFPFKLAEKNYRFKTLSPEAIQGQSFRRVSACFDDRCMVLFVTPTLRASSLRPISESAKKASRMSRAMVTDRSAGFSATGVSAGMVVTLSRRLSFAVGERHAN